MKLEEITEIKNTSDANAPLNFPGKFIYGSSLVIEDRSSLEELMNTCGWDCLSAVGTIIDKQDIEPLKKEFNTYLSAYVEKYIEYGQPEEDITSLIIYEINGYYYAFILYMYESEYAVNTFDNLGYSEDNLVYIGVDNNDYDLIETIVYECFEYEEDDNYGELKDEEDIDKVLFEFYKLIVPWTKNNPDWADEYKLLTEGFDDF